MRALLWVEKYRWRIHRTLSRYYPGPGTDRMEKPAGRNNRKSLTDDRGFITSFHSGNLLLPTLPEVYQILMGLAGQGGGTNDGPLVLMENLQPVGDVALVLQIAL